jgi:tetratricopeptide (TPR) repeat protein
MTDLGDFDSAEKKLHEAIEIAQEIGNRQGEATWRGELGIHHLTAGRQDAAAQELTRCLAIAREIGFARYEAWAQLYLGALSLQRDFDKLEEARQWIEGGLEIAQDLGNEELRIVGLVHLARLKRAEGDLGRAKETLERADLLARASQNLRLRSWVSSELR